MYDIKWIRENPEEFDKGLERKGLAPRSAEVLDLDKKYRACQTDLQEMQSRRNDLSRQVAEVKKNGGDAEVLMHEVGALKRGMADMEEDGRLMAEQIDKLLSSLPNRPADDVPDGPDDSLMLKSVVGVNRASLISNRLNTMNLAQIWV